MNRRAYALGAAMALLCNAASVALRSYAEAAFIAERGAARLPWLLVANAVGFAVATLGYDAITRLRRAPPRVVDPGLVLALAAAAAASPWLLAARVQPVVLVVALAALSQVAGLAVWNRVAASVAGRDARRMLPRAGAAVTAGGAIAGLVAAPAVLRLGAAALPIGAAAISVVMLALAVLQQRALDAGGAPGGARAAEPQDTAKLGRDVDRDADGDGRPPALALVQRHVLRGFVVVAMLEAAVATVADLQFAAAIKAHYAADAVAIAVALFYGGTNLVLLVLQLAAVPRLLVTRSLAFTAVLHPLLVGAAYAVVAAVPGFAVIAGARTADQVMRGATSRPAQELALSALPAGARARWKMLLRGVVWPAAAAAAALGLLAIGPAAIERPGAIAAVAVVIALAWTVAAAGAARRFQAALAAPLGIRAPAAAEGARIDLRTLEAWTEAAGGEDPRDAALARAALERARVDPADLAAHLRHDSPAVRAAMFDQLARAPTPALRGELRAAVAIEDDDRALALAIKALAIAGDDAGITRGAQRAGLARAVDEAVATATLALRGGDAIAELPALADRDPAWAAAIVRARRSAGGAALDEPALTAAWLAARATGASGCAATHGGPSAGVLAAIALVGPDAALGALESALAAGDRAALAAIGDLDLAGAAYLAARVAAWAPAARLALARALRGAPHGGELVGALLGDADPEVAYAALRTALATARAGRSVAAASLAAAHDAALAAVTAYLDARDDAAAWTACARGELDVATRRAAARLLWAAAARAAAAGRDPAPLAATARHLTRGNEADRRRALDVAQELLAGRADIVDLLERWLRAPAAGGTVTALAIVDPWLAELARGHAPAAMTEPLVALRRCAPFAAVAGPALAGLASRATAVALAAGEELFAEGAAGHAMYVVVRGSLSARRGTGTPRAIAAGEVIGELAVLTSAPRAARVIAEAPGADLLVIDRAAFVATARRAPELVLGLCATLAGWIAPGRADVLP